MATNTATVEPTSDMSKDYRDGLRSLLVAQALPVWGWGQSGVYEKFVMQGYELDHWVRTAHMWAEVERHLWEWRQMVAPLGVSEASVPPWLHGIAERLSSAVLTWSDLALCEEYLDGVGFSFISSCTESSYGPLARGARIMTPSKWGHVATGHVHLAEMLNARQVDVDQLSERVPIWRQLASEVADRVTDEESQWASSDVASRLDLSSALSDADKRIEALLGMSL